VTGDLYFAAELSVRLTITDSVFTHIWVKGLLLCSCADDCLAVDFLATYFFTGDLKAAALFSG